VGGTSDEGTAIDDCAGWSWLSCGTESANGGEEKEKFEKKTLLAVRWVNSIIIKILMYM
jgi:hypothetical protein